MKQRSVHIWKGWDIHGICDRGYHRFGAGRFGDASGSEPAAVFADAG